MRLANPALTLTRKHTMNRILAALLACALTTTATGALARAQSEASELSGASVLVAGSAVVAGGSMLLLGSTNIVVASVEAVGDGVVVVFKGASDASKATVRFSSDAAARASFVAGALVSVTVIASGYLIVSAGKVLAFIPNESAKALMHHSRVSGQ